MKFSVLRIRDVYPGFEFFSIPDPHKILVFLLTQKIVSKLSEIWSELFIPDPGTDFLSISDPGSATVEILNDQFFLLSYSAKVTYLSYSELFLSMLIRK